MNSPDGPLLDRIQKLSEGNPGALNVLGAVLRNFDADLFQALEEFEISGTQIYILANDVCGKDYERFAQLLRATKQGRFELARLKEMASDQTRQSEITESEWLTITTGNR